jgi:predicted amidophosphoribosyltransferase
MNRRTCINCQTAWSSLADHELESPHVCPRCGDELTPVHQAQSEPEVGRARSLDRP